MKIEFDVKLTVGDMYNFQFNNTYRKPMGIVWLIFSIVAAVVVVITWGKVELYKSILLIIMAALFTIINPIVLWFQALRQIKTNKTFQKPLHYVIDEEGITVSQGEASETTLWSNMWKAVKYGNQVVIYVTNMRVFNLPLRCIGTQYDELVSLLRTGLSERSKIKA